MTVHRHLVKGIEEGEGQETVSHSQRKERTRHPRRIRNMIAKPQTERGVVLIAKGPLTDIYMSVLTPLMHTPVDVRSLVHKLLWRPDGLLQPFGNPVYLLAISHRLTVSGRATHHRREDYTMIYSLMAFSDC
jgi:hypothetical protein